MQKAAACRNADCMHVHPPLPWQQPPSYPASLGRAGTCRATPLAPTSATAAARSSPACRTLRASTSTSRLTSLRCSSFSPRRMAALSPVLPPAAAAAAAAAGCVEVLIGGSCGSCSCQGSAASVPSPSKPPPEGCRLWVLLPPCSANPVNLGSEPSQSPNSEEAADWGAAWSRRLGCDTCQPPPLLPAAAAAAASTLLLLLLLGGAGGAGLVPAVYGEDGGRGLARPLPKGVVCAPAALVRLWHATAGSRAQPIKRHTQGRKVHVRDRSQATYRAVMLLCMHASACARQRSAAALLHPLPPPRPCSASQPPPTLTHLCCWARAMALSNSRNCRSAWLRASSGRPIRVHNHFSSSPRRLWQAARSRGFGEVVSSKKHGQHLVVFPVP